MASLLTVVIYLAFIGLGLPDSLPGSAWPTMYPQPDPDVPALRSPVSSLHSSLFTLHSY